MAQKKFKKYPKMPKRTASLTVWENYEKRVAEVNKYNQSLVAETKKKEQVMQKVKKMMNKL